MKGKSSCPFFISLLLMLLVSSLFLFAGELTFDVSTGKTFGFDLSTADNPTNPTSYTNTAEIWEKHGFVGRIVYVGQPTELSFTNTGVTATGTPNNMFYFNRKAGGVTQPGQWREFFLVTRVKGLLHNGSQDDYVGSNNRIDQNGGSVSISEGSGPDKVSDGENGYNDRGGGWKEPVVESPSLQI